MMDDIEEELANSATSPLVISIDRYFNVKGIGLVAIGYVQCGTLRVHDELHISPSNGGGYTNLNKYTTMFKCSIGDRVGIAIRGAKDDSLSNGSIIVKPAINDKKTNNYIGHRWLNIKYRN